MNKPLISLENKDCFEFLRTVPTKKKISLILTDPPYLISRNTNFSSGKEKGTNVDRFRISMDFGDWDKTRIDLDSLLKEFYRILKPSGTLIIFYDLWKISYLKESLENQKFKQIRFLEWLKTNPVPLNSKKNYLTNAREIAVSAVKAGNPTFHSEYDNGIYSFPICHEKNRFHPTQKPLKLFERLIEKHSDEEDFVLDCFSDSGTTALACQNLNRNFLGCEISKEFYDKSLKRLEERN